MKAITTQEASLVDGLFSWWYRIAVPPEVPDDAPLRDRMRVRSGKLTGMLILFEIIAALVTLIVLIIEQNTFAALIVGMVLISLIIATILNRLGKTTAAGILLIVVEEIGVILSIVGFGNLVVDSASLLDFNFFIVSELIAASLLTPWVTFPLTLGNCLITAAIITFASKAPDLIQALSDRAFYIYAYPVEIQLLVATVCFLWASSTFREMRRANNAEEVSNLTMALAKQQQTEDLKKRQLEESIEQILSVHMEVANGNWHARVSLSKQNVLWSLAGSLNNLLARLQSWRYDAARLQKNEQAIQQLLQNIQRAKWEKKPMQVYKTGTPLDSVIQEISKGIAEPQQTNELSSNPLLLHRMVDGKGGDQ